MIIPPHGSTSGTAPCRVEVSNRLIRICNESLFQGDSGPLRNQLLLRVLQVSAVRSVRLSLAESTLSIAFDTETMDQESMLRCLAQAIRDTTSAFSFLSLPRSSTERDQTIFKHGSVLSTCEVVGDLPGYLRVRHPRFKNDSLAARESERLLKSVKGVRQANVSTWTGILSIRYDANRLSFPRLIRLIEESVEAPAGWAARLPVPTKTRFGMANLTLLTATLTDFVTPFFMPVSVGLLIGTNLRTFQAARLQFEHRKFGLPALYVIIVVTTVISGQFLASALMSLSFKYWHNRMRQEVARERCRVIDHCLPQTSLARLILADGTEVLVPIEKLQPGDQFRVGPDEVVPADGIILEGQGILDERSLEGLDGVSRKSPTEMVLACSTLLAGSILAEVVRPSEETRSSEIVRSLVASTSPASGPLTPTMRAERFADRTVGATLATAGVGLLVGDLTAASAILRPDYATGPGVSMPLETLRSAALCVQKGIITRQPDIFERLASVDQIALIDSPRLRSCELEVSTIEARLPEAELLRFAASTFRHIADDRASALVRACYERRIHLLNLETASYSPGITCVSGKHKIRVSELGEASEAEGPLLVEVDGCPIGKIEFRRSSRPQAASFIQEIQEAQGLKIVLLSDRSRDETASLAESLGIKDYRSDLNSDSTAGFLERSASAGLRTALIGESSQLAGISHHAFVSVSITNPRNSERDPASVLLLRGRFDRFAELIEIARSHSDRVRSAERFIVLPNVICVAGALFFGATALTAVILSNLGTLALHQRAIDSLQGFEPRSLSSPNLSEVSQG